MQVIKHGGFPLAIIFNLEQMRRSLCLQKNVIFRVAI